MAAVPQLAPDGREIVWAPNSAPQRALLSCPVFEVFFGGARGGGKTDGMLGDWAQHASAHGKHAIGLMVRRTRLQLTETFERAKAIFTPIGAKFTEQPMRCVMPGGARLNFAYLERDADADNYQGHSYTRVYIEEAGNFPSASPIMKLMATLRSGAGVPCRIRLTGNPGGVGHHWVKARYVDPAPAGMKVLTDAASSKSRVYIPSRVSDNVNVAADYVDNLRLSGSPELVRAWLEGDWDIVSGAYFPEWDSSRHTMAPFTVPEHWARFRAFDWGSARPFCCLWFAVSDGSLSHIPRGALVVYREWYGTTGEPNIGLRMTARPVARGILEREAGDHIQTGVADPAIFTADGGPSIAEEMGAEGVYWSRADNARVARRGSMGGWDQIRARLNGDEGRSMLIIFKTCIHLIRTLPALQHDTNQPEDVDTDGEDHAPDTLRYGCMSRPWIKEQAPQAQKRDSWKFDDDDADGSWRTA